MTTKTTADLNLSDREFRGLKIALQPDSIKSVGSGRFRVASQSSDTQYTVWYSRPANAYRCDCPDNRRGECKHGIACRLREKAAAQIMAARRAGRGDALIGKMLTTSLMGDAGLVAADRAMTADLVLLVARMMDAQQSMGRAA